MSSYVRVPIQESNSNSSLPTIEEKDSSSRSNSNSNLKQQDEVPASKVMVIFSVGFYLVAATTSKRSFLVVTSSWILVGWDCEKKKSSAKLEICFFSFQSYNRVL